jgi:hypothetical protein
MPSSCTRLLNARLRARGVGNDRRQFYLIILLVAARFAGATGGRGRAGNRDRASARRRHFVAEPAFVTAIIGEQHSASSMNMLAFSWRPKMNDRYTKIVLTVIAVALTVIAARDWLPARTATAQNGPVRVIIDSVEPYAFQRTTVPVKVANYW